MCQKRRHNRFSPRPRWLTALFTGAKTHLHSRLRRHRQPRPGKLDNGSHSLRKRSRAGKKRGANRRLRQSPYRPNAAAIYHRHQHWKAKGTKTTWRYCIWLVLRPNDTHRQTGHIKNTPNNSSAAKRTLLLSPQAVFCPKRNTACGAYTPITAKSSAGKNLKQPLPKAAVKGKIKTPAR